MVRGELRLAVKALCPRRLGPSFTIGQIFPAIIAGRFEEQNRETCFLEN
jgi:hypothetical protein